MSSRFDIQISEEVQQALREKRGVVALESTIISHGLPRPQNEAIAAEIEAEVRSSGAVPATIALIGGVLKVGLSAADIEFIARDSSVLKLGTRDLAYAITNGLSGATTVSATMWSAYQAGIKIFATGGIGGVHREAESTWDISSDLTELGRTPVAVVSAGAKSILDLPKTLEYLETMMVPVIGYRTSDFPSFYSRQSGLALEMTAQTPEEIARLLRIREAAGFREGVIIANPIDAEEEIPFEEMESSVRKAIEMAKSCGVTGKQLTPFLLSKLPALTAGKSLTANVALVKSNARLAGLIAVESGV